MEVLNYFKQLFKDKNAIATQISLFSLVGIFVILFIKYAASWVNLLFEDFYIAVPSSNLELWMYLFAGIVLLIYFSGFSINLMRNVITGKSSVLPEITLRPYVYFVKCLPYGLYLSVCYFLISIVGVLLLVKTGISGLYYTFASVMFCLSPFFMMLFIEFLKTMSLKKEQLNIFRVFKLLELTLGEVIFLSVQMSIIFAIVVFIIYSLLNIKIPEGFYISALAFNLAVSVIGIYALTLINFAYLIGLADILKGKVVKF